MARPTLYSPELAQRIAAAFAVGESFSSICQHDWAPKSMSTILEWEDRYPEFEAAMTTARKAHAEVLIERMQKIVETERDPQRGRMQLEHLRWLTSKYNRHRYADKIDMTVAANVSITAALDAATARLHATIDGTYSIIGDTPGGADWSVPALPAHHQPTAAGEPLPSFFD